MLERGHAESGQPASDKKMRDELVTMLSDGPTATSSWSTTSSSLLISRRKPALAVIEREPKAASSASRRGWLIQLVSPAIRLKATKSAVPQTAYFWPRSRFSQVMRRVRDRPLWLPAQLGLLPTEFA
jgi:hypothetical protein